MGWIGLMILIVHSWVCTLCGFSKTFDPAVETPPEICPACGKGAGHYYERN